MSSLVYNTSTTSKRSLWPAEAADLWVTHAHGSRLRLSNGKWYTDWASALGANTLGYGAAQGWAFQPAASMPWRIEGEFAEQFCDAMGTEAVRFFKSGSDALSCAVRLARGFTGRSGIIVFDKSYHGTGDWFGPALWTRGGIPRTVDMDTYVEAFAESIDLSYRHEIDDVAAIVIEPVPKSVLLPPTGWLQHLREVCDASGALLISDEVILGYRHSLRGYLSTAGIVPDLVCYGKAMAQGSALSACTGRKDVMQLLEKDVHFSGTNNGEPMPLAIAQWTLEQYQQKDICRELANTGRRLKTLLFSNGFDTTGLDERFEVVLEDKMSATSFCFDRGILFPGFCSMAVSHTEEQIAALVEALMEWRAQA